jgi:hypothetical protein
MLIGHAQGILGTCIQILKLAKHVHVGRVGPLRVGFSPFVNSRNCGYFVLPMRLFSGVSDPTRQGDTVSRPPRLERVELYCDILSLPITGSNWLIQPRDKTPLVVVMRTYDPHARQSESTSKR